ncbi:hypothetical protein TVAG_192780 [Trichomonas vaginalis G3]|uniref:Baseplate structural protein Gp10 C-terminal domain-containing protein n=1 Tax=Trichomonas vaginalis (strain ATCC PRA-98 / G3) TaxID=412133 RepID=A2DGZ2_TRIV3|nr:phage tail repeat-like family [Trichomonas vaginalis G3]EAY20302.1 hypothetical protein TVAG_192780 [Trichomonas vaginalis G3]KAI5530713.1 phage tail repeat-like family [Trichomonas vaginalis G3]|eukprot:XP_001581288.1 hypothetical protein [Trichomonas vaginalis G3]
MEDGQQLKELEKGVTELRNTKADLTWITEYVDATKEYIFAWTEGTYPQNQHTHNISDVNELQEKLDDKADKETVDMLAETVSSHTRGLMEDSVHLQRLDIDVSNKADKNHTHTSFTTFTADDITLNTTLPSKAPKIPPATSLVDTLISNDNSIMHLRQELNVLKQILPNLIYPVSSLYVSMNSTNPKVVLGFGTWTQIVDRFLYCSNSSKQTGGSKTISGENLPAHSHYVNINTAESGWHSHRYWD